VLPVSIVELYVLVGGGVYFTDAKKVQMDYLYCDRHYKWFQAGWGNINLSGTYSWE